MGGGGCGARVTGRAPLPVGGPSHARAHAHDASSEGSEWDDDVLGDAATTTCSGRPAARRDGDSNAGSHAALRIFLAAKLHAERRSSGGAAFIHRPPTFLTARNCVCYVWRRTMFGGCNRGFNFFWEVSKAPPSPIRNMHTPRLTDCMRIGQVISSALGRKVATPHDQGCERLSLLAFVLPALHGSPDSGRPYADESRAR